VTTYPVHYRIEHPHEMSRLQLLVRFVAFCALGVLGLSFGSVFVFGYLALPVIAAIRTSGRAPEAYATTDAPVILKALRWLAALSAWTAVISDRLPLHTPDEIVTLEIDGTTHPTPASAMSRLITGIPSAFVLWFLGLIGVFVWLWAVLSILFVQRIGQGTFDYLVGLQRWSIRLLAYQASLVDEYPPFSFADPPATHVAAA